MGAAMGARMSEIGGLVFGRRTYEADPVADAAGLIDEYMLLIHPLVLGTGRRLFPDGTPLTTLRLVDTKTTTTGVVIASYQPTEPQAAA